MKTAGIIIFIIGLFMTVYAGITCVATEMVADLGELEITKDGQHIVRWQPYVGIGTMVIGGTLLTFGRKGSVIT